MHDTCYLIFGTSFAEKDLTLCFTLQIHEEARKFAYQTGVRVVVAYGGAPINQQVLFLVPLEIVLIE